MGKIDLKGRIKLIQLRMKRIFRVLFRDLLYKSSFIIVIFSFMVNMWLLLPSLFDRMPVFSYFINKLELPITYVINGTVRIVDVEGNIKNNDVIVFIGGHQAKIGSEIIYELEFSSPKNDFFFISIIYSNQEGEENQYTEKISFPIDSHVIRKDFVIKYN